jgi:Flp pilus assembly protein TadD
MSPFLVRAIGVVAFCCAALAGVARADDASELSRLFEAGQKSEALDRVEQLLEAKPRDPQLRFLKGVMLADTGRQADAERVFTELTVDYPEIPEPYNNLAVIHAAQGNYDKARALLETALRASPNYAVAHENLGDIHAQLARLSYTHALQLEPSNATIAPKLALLRQLIRPIAAAPAAPAAQ